MNEIIRVICAGALVFASHGACAGQAVFQPDIEVLQNPSGDVRVTFYGRFGFDYSIDTADNLANWVELFSAPGADATIECLDIGGGADGKRFYRVRETEYRADTQSYIEAIVNAGSSLTSEGKDAVNRLFQTIEDQGLVLEAGVLFGSGTSGILLDQQLDLVSPGSRRFMPVSGSSDPDLISLHPAMVSMHNDSGTDTSDGKLKYADAAGAGQPFFSGTGDHSYLIIYQLQRLSDGRVNRICSQFFNSSFGSLQLYQTSTLHRIAIAGGGGGVVRASNSNYGSEGELIRPFPTWFTQRDTLFNVYDAFDDAGIPLLPEFDSVHPIVQSEFQLGGLGGTVDRVDGLGVSAILKFGGVLSTAEREAFFAAIMPVVFLRAGHVSIIGNSVESSVNLPEGWSATWPALFALEGVRHGQFATKISRSTYDLGHFAPTSFPRTNLSPQSANVATEQWRGWGFTSIINAENQNSALKFPAAGLTTYAEYKGAFQAIVDDWTANEAFPADYKVLQTDQNAIKRTEREAFGWPSSRIDNLVGFRQAILSDASGDFGGVARVYESLDTVGDHAAAPSPQAQDELMLDDQHPGAAGHRMLFHSYWSAHRKLLGKGFHAKLLHDFRLDQLTDYAAALSKAAFDSIGGARLLATMSCSLEAQAGLGNVVSLDGVDAKMVASNDLADLPGSFTVAGWVLVDSGDATGTIFRFDLGRGAGAGAEIRVAPQGADSLRVEINYGGSGAVAADVFFPFDSWGHLAFTFDGSGGSGNGRFFVDGALVATAGGASEAWTTELPRHVQFGSEDDIDFVKCKVGRWRVFDAVLDDGAIELLADE